MTYGNKIHRGNMPSGGDRNPQEDGVIREDLQEEEAFKQTVKDEKEPAKGRAGGILSQEEGKNHAESGGERRS